jgi:hypothetical protein
VSAPSSIFCGARNRDTDGGKGANGRLLCLRYLLQNMDWLEEELGGYDDDYLIFDCPGTLRSFRATLDILN